MTDLPLWQLDATEIAARTTAGDLSAEAVVGAAVARMRAVNPDLNAVVVDLGDSALEEARLLDAARARGQVAGPLHGVPVTIKINVDQKDEATSNGLPVLRDFLAPEDAPLVRNLRAAGAIVIGRTNTPEFSFRADTTNPLFGRTHNPWGRHISAGGSSGGAGAAVMAGMGALAHGNDIGGSLRFPAMANGAVTVKPGMGRVPAWNPSQKAERGMLAQAMSVQGLIARSARDLHLSMPPLIVADARDPFHVPLPWRGAAPDGPIRVGFTDAVPGHEVHADVLLALQAAREALEDAGYVLEQIDAPAMPEAAEVGFRALMTEVSLMMMPDIETHGSPELNAIFAEYFRAFPPYEPGEYLRAVARRSHFARQWSLLCDRYPLVLTPFMPQPTFAPGRDAQGAEGVAEVMVAGLWSTSINFMGLPAGNVPTRLAQRPEGPVPISVQLVGRRWREDLIVDAMIEIEKRLGGLSTVLWGRD